MQHLIRICLLWPFLVSLPLLAAELKQPPVDPTGTWKWTYTTREGNSIEARIRLKLVEGKLTGVAVGEDQKEIPIEDPKLESSQLKFQVTRQTMGKKFRTLYEGKITGDRIVGTLRSGTTDLAPKRDWEAVRAKEITPTPNDKSKPAGAAH